MLYTVDFERVWLYFIESKTGAKGDLRDDKIMPPKGTAWSSGQNTYGQDLAPPLMSSVPGQEIPSYELEIGIMGPVWKSCCQDYNAPSTKQRLKAKLQFQ